MPKLSKTCRYCVQPAHTDFRGHPLICPADAAFGPYDSKNFLHNPKPKTIRLRRALTRARHHTTT